MYREFLKGLQRRIQNPSRTSKMELFLKIENGFQPLTIFAKILILDVKLAFRASLQYFNKSKLKWKNSAKSLKRTLEKRHKLHFCFISCELHRILPLAIWGTAVLGLRRPYIFPYLWGAQNFPHFRGETKDKQKQPSRSVLRKRCFENMQQIYRRTPMPKWNFNKVALQLYLNLTLLLLLTLF